MTAFDNAGQAHRKTPAFHITVQGQDRTEVLDTRLLSLTLTDNCGLDSDELKLELDDVDGKVPIPERGTVIEVKLGWKGQEPFPHGKFMVSMVEHQGTPDKLSVTANSINFNESLSTRVEKSWHRTTVGAVVKEIAGRHGLKAALSEEMLAKPLEHIDQTGESDASFLTRLARLCGAQLTVKDDHLLFIRQGQGKTASGRPMPLVILTRRMGDGHKLTLLGGEAYTGVTATWLDTREPKKKETVKWQTAQQPEKQQAAVSAGGSDGTTATDAVPKDVPLAGSSKKMLKLNRVFGSRAEAERAAKSQWERIQRSAALLSLKLADGRPDLYTDMLVRASGFKDLADNTEWIINKLTHSLTPGEGFTTSIELSLKIDNP